MHQRQLLYFCGTVDAGSASAAAERLHVAPTAISMQIMQLEELIGGLLFDRSRRPMTLTALGTFLYPRAKELLRDDARLMDEARAIADGHSGWLVVGYTRSSLFSILPRAVKLFGQTYPAVRLELMTMFSEQQPDQLREGRIQAGVARYIGTPAPDPSLRYTPLLTDAFCIAVPPEHHFAAEVEVPVRALAELPLITYPKEGQSGFAAGALDLVRRAGVEPQVVRDAPDIHTALGLVAAGLGCTLIGQSVRDGSRRDIVFVRLSDFLHGHSTLYAATASGSNTRALDGLVAALVQVGQEIAAEDH